MFAKNRRFCWVPVGVGVSVGAADAKLEQNSARWSPVYSRAWEEGDAEPGRSLMADLY